MQQTIIKKPDTSMTLLLWFSIIIVTNTYAQHQKQRDTLTLDEPMNSTGCLVSPSGTFRLGFFTPGRSQNRYLGLWYNNIPEQTVVWVASRRNPIQVVSSTTAANVLLRLDFNGTLLLTNHNSTIVYWESNSSASAGGGNTMQSSRGAVVAFLLDTGNLQVVDRAAGNRIVWQSFDYPADTILPGMKLGIDLRSGLNRRITAWKSKDDPAPGDASMGIDVRGVPQIFLDSRGVPQIFLTDIAGDLLQWRSGPWNGIQFTGTPEMKSFFNLVNFPYVADPSKEVYFHYTEVASFTARLVVYSNPGVAEFLVWNLEMKTWVALWFDPKDRCDAVSRCGPYEICGPNDAPPCSCIQGFRHQDGSEGCVRETPKDCSNGTDGFLILHGAKLPDTSNATMVGKGSMGLTQCATECLRNCTCTAYAAADISVSPTQSGCIIWTSTLRDLRLYANGTQDLYVRLAAKDLGPSLNSQHQKKVRVRVIIPAALLAGLALLGCIGWALHHKCNNGRTAGLQDSWQLLDD